MTDTDQELGFATRAIHAGERSGPLSGQNTPIFQTAAFSFETAADKSAAMDSAMAWEGGYFYTRTGNPTTTALEEKLAALDGAESAVVGSSGMGSVATALLAHLDAGDHLVITDDLFIITRFLVENDLPKKGVEVTSVDITDLDAVRAAVRPETRVIFTESVSNPNMRVADLPALVDIAHRVGALLMVDNTFLGPSLLRPLELGADLVIHSATKYLSGHGDALAGVVAGARELIDPIRYTLDVLGSCASPFNSWLVLRGVRTLALRMAAHNRNAAALAEMLERHPAVETVLYPGLESHPDHAVAARLFGPDYGGMMAIRLHGDRSTMEAFADGLVLCEMSVSLGDVFTLVYPMPKRNNLIRISVGCETTGDILTDIAQALDHIPGEHPPPGNQCPIR